LDIKREVKMERSDLKFECNCGHYNNDLKVEFDEKGVYCPDCGGYCVLTEQGKKDRIIEILDETLPYYPLGETGLGGHKSEGREGFIERLADKLKVY
jgi:hypothetical protein